MVNGEAVGVTPAASWVCPIAFFSSSRAFNAFAALASDSALALLAASISFSYQGLLSASAPVVPVVAVFPVVPVVAVAVFGALAGGVSIG